MPQLPERKAAKIIPADGQIEKIRNHESSQLSPESLVLLAQVTTSWKRLYLHALSWNPNLFDTESDLVENRRQKLSTLRENIDTWSQTKDGKHNFFSALRELFGSVNLSDLQARAIDCNQQIAAQLEADYKPVIDFILNGDLEAAQHALRQIETKYQQFLDTDLDGTRYSATGRDVPTTNDLQTRPTGLSYFAEDPSSWLDMHQEGQSPMEIGSLMRQRAFALPLEAVCRTNAQDEIRPMNEILDSSDTQVRHAIALIPEFGAVVVEVDGDKIQLFGLKQYKSGTTQAEVILMAAEETLFGDSLTVQGKTTLAETLPPLIPITQSEREPEFAGKYLPISCISGLEGISLEFPGSAGLSKEEKVDAFGMRLKNVPALVGDDTLLIE